MIIKFKNLYLKAPRPVKESVRLIPFGFRMGAAYRRTLRFLVASDKWGHDQYRAYQERELARLLNLAIRYVPHYKRYDSLLSRPPFDILREIEPVTKSEIQRDLDSFVLPESMRGKHYVAYTGGSSGHPLKMFLNNDVAEIEWAYMVAQWMRAGYRPGDKRVSFRGVEFKNDRESTVRQNPVYNEILLSPFDMTDENLARYVKVIKKQKPKFLRGYPSALMILSRYIEQNQITDLPELTALLCSSEGFTDELRQMLERVFRTRFYSWYGMTEKAVLAGECEKSTSYHVFPQYGITEIMDAEGNLSSEPGCEGEIVGTGFLNRAMPF
ncbi:MAG: AMP-binding protein, partial [candidate division Zixibacteria bacterium]|nr:AMP-binding protein [candidate division Zixibacteria bacterium]